MQTNWTMELAAPQKREGAIRYALFDFDGTLSLIREGWQDIMIPYFTEVLAEAAPQENPEALRAEVREFVDKLTGKQTIFQCIRLAEEVQTRGGTPLPPLEYKKEYLRRLGLRIQGRKEALRQGENPEAHLVRGSRAFLQALCENGIRCYLASGTDEADVQEEAALLGLTGYFAGGVHGARDEMLECSKEMVIRDMMEREGIRPRELASFGDGYVEVELVKNLGGHAVGVATDEANRRGVDEWKRNRLLSAGAEAIIPDFEDVQALMAWIKGEV